MNIAYDPTVMTTPAVAAAMPAPRMPLRKHRPPALLALVMVAIFIPEAMSFYFSDMRLSLARVILMILSPLIVFAFGRLLASANYRVVWSDILFPALFAWMIFAPAQIDGLDRALKSGGGNGFDFIFAYMVMRSMMRGVDDVHALIRVCCTAAAVSGLLAILDVAAGSHVLREDLAHITGYSFYGGGHTLHEYRLGLLRAQGPLEHPIMFGIVMCYALLLTRDLSGRRRFFCRFGCGIGLFLSLSSAPWLAIIVGLMLVAYRRLARFPHPWGVLVSFGAVAGLAFFFLHPNPIGWMLGHLTLDASTGYYRLLTWQYAGADVMQSPWLGIGMTDDWARPHWMPKTVDSLWLRSAMTFGIPGSLLIAAALVGASSLPVRQTATNAATIGEREVVLAETLGIITFLTLFLGFTVHYWGACWFLVGAFAGLRGYLGQLAAK